MTVHPIRPAALQPAAVDLDAVEAEECVLGAAMLAPQALHWLLGNLREDDFHRPAHRTVYAAIATLARSGAPVDPVSVTAALRRQGQLAGVGGAAFVHTLVSCVPTVAHAGYYGRIVATQSRLRRLHDVATTIAVLVAEPHADPDRVLGTAQGLLERAADTAAPVGLRPPDLLAALRQQPGAWAGPAATWPTRTLDELCGPLAPGTLTLLAGLPTGAAVSLALQTAVHNAARVHVLYVTYRLRPADLARRTLVLAGSLRPADTDAGQEAPTSRLAAARQAHSLLDLTVYGHRPDAGRLLAQTGALNARRAVGLAVVDDLGRVPLPAGAQRATSEQERSEITRVLKTMAERCDLPVLACTRPWHAPAGHQPALLDPPASGVLQDADQVLLVRQPAPGATLVEATLAEHPTRLPGTRRLCWDPERATLADPTEAPAAPGGGSVQKAAQ